MRRIVVIGNGVAGITAAVRIREHSAEPITIISDESDYFFSRTALMYVYMGHMEYRHLRPYEDGFWKANNFTLRRDFATAIDTATRTVHLCSGDPAPYDILIVATGSRSNRPDRPGLDARGVQCLYSLGDLERMEHDTRGIDHAVVVGGGLIGVEAAEMLRSRGIGVSLLVREARYWGSVLPPEEAAIVERRIRAHGVDLRLTTELDSVLPDSDGRVRAIVTSAGDTVDCRFVLLAVGVHPNIGMVRQSAVACNRGVLVNEYFETSVPGVYAVGDCAEIVDDTGASRIEPLWYAARAHGAAVARTVLGERTRYERGVFFNSAKFFDIEYQTYGTVHSAPAPGEQSVYWEHPDGNRCIRIVYTADGVAGFNLLGVRFRHEVCSRWIEERRSIDFVVDRLGEANFDPEFTQRYEREVRAVYNRSRHTATTTYLQETD